MSKGKTIPISSRISDRVSILSTRRESSDLDKVGTTQNSKLNSFASIIGLEVHIELKTESKMFCGCSANHFRVKPNTHTCPVCLGLPGALPVPNKKAIEMCLIAGIALGCQIPKFSKFDRKNYYYPDLPKGYQISQYDLPFARHGELKLKIKNEKLKIIRIRRVHLEEDTAKLVHQRGNSFIDFNRSGVPLMEVVSEPDINNSGEAKAYLKRLQQIIRYLGISDCDMEKGSMRLEANVSLQEFPISIRQPARLSADRQARTARPARPVGGLTDQLPKYKVEIKNLNSFRFVEKSLEYEIERQKALLRAGRKLSQETRGWDEVKQVTFPQRIKETSADYRYFPEPDIPPIKWGDEEIKKLRNSLPELPDEKIKRFVKDYGLNEYEAEILCREKITADYFEKTITLEQGNPREIARLITNKRVNINIISPQQLVKNLIKKKKAKISDEFQLEIRLQDVIKENQKAVEDYQRGKKEAIGYLIGQVMRKTKGKADAKIARKILIEKLSCL